MKISEKDLDLLIGKVKTNDISSLEYQEEDFSIAVGNTVNKIVSSDTLSKVDNFEYQTTSNNNNENNNNKVETNTQEESNDDTDIYSPLIGNFYLTKDPASKPFVKIGDSVKKGDVICVIEAMKMISEVKAEVNGKITKICSEVGSFVDLDTVIFKISEE